MTARTNSVVLDEQLCFALYAASRAMTARYRPLLDAVGLTYPQFLVLVVLWEDGPATVQQLGARLQLDSGTLSPLLKRLETGGLVTRTRRTDDERSVIIEPTAKAHQMQGQVFRIPATVRSSLRNTEIGDAEIAGLTADIHRLTAALRAEPTEHIRL